MNWSTGFGSKHFGDGALTWTWLTVALWVGLGLGFFFFFPQKINSN